MSITHHFKSQAIYQITSNISLTAIPFTNRNSENVDVTAYFFGEILALI